MCTCLTLTSRTNSDVLFHFVSWLIDWNLLLHRKKLKQTGRPVRTFSITHLEARASCTRLLNRQPSFAGICTAEASVFICNINNRCAYNRSIRNANMAATLIIISTSSIPDSHGQWRVKPSVKVYSLRTFNCQVVDIIMGYDTVWLRIHVATLHCEDVNLWHFVVMRNWLPTLIFLLPRCPIVICGY